MNDIITISANGEVLCRCSAEAEGTITIPEGIVAIKQNAFARCKTITHVVLPSTLRKIGSNAFQGCVSLRCVNIPRGVKYIGKGAFKDCHHVESVIIPGSMHTLNTSIFENNYALKYVKMSEGIHCIEDHSFKNCLSLVKVIIPRSVTSMGRAFVGCWSLSRVILKSVRLDIKKSAFAGCDAKLTINCNITIKKFFDEPTKQKIINPKHIIGKKALAGKILPPYTLLLNNMGEIEIIGEEAFRDCTGIEIVGISESVRIIRARAFSGCTGLTKLTFKEGVEVIGQNAFENCTGLTSLHLPDSLKEIEDSSFAGCTSLTDVSLSRKTLVDANAFDAENNITFTYR